MMQKLITPAFIRVETKMDAQRLRDITALHTRRWAEEEEEEVEEEDITSLDCVRARNKQ